MIARTLLTMLIVALAGPHAQAQLTLTIVPDTTTYSLSGSATGTPGSFGNFNWEGTTTVQSNGGGSVLTNNPTNFTWSGPETPDVSNIISGGFGSFTFNISVTGNGGTPGTVTGTGVPISYAAQTPSQIQAIESADGISMNLTSGSGVGPLSVVVVPEPTSLALLGLGGLIVARRRR
ncbi:MAG: PEP-CTERM sorting domain-containing protein [Planctomycetota bacterium]